MLLSELVYISMINVAHKCRLKNGRNEVGMLEKIMGADVKIMDRFFRYRKVPLPRKIFKTRISA